MKFSCFGLLFSALLFAHSTVATGIDAVNSDSPKGLRGSKSHRQLLSDTVSGLRLISVATNSAVADLTDGA